MIQVIVMSPTGTHDDPREPMGTHGEAMGTHGAQKDPWETMGIRGNPRGPPPGARASASRVPCQHLRRHGTQNKQQSKQPTAAPSTTRGGAGGGCTAACYHGIRLAHYHCTMVP